MSNYTHDKIWSNVCVAHPDPREEVMTNQIGDLGIEIGNVLYEVEEGTGLSAMSFLGLLVTVISVTIDERNSVGDSYDPL